jgi:hypothetical protein
MRRGFESGRAFRNATRPRLVGFSRARSGLGLSSVGGTSREVCPTSEHSLGLLQKNSSAKV